LGRRWTLGATRFAHSGFLTHFAARRQIHGNRFARNPGAPLPVHCLVKSLLGSLGWIALLKSVARER
jgi:hypothetical protein